MRRPFCVILLLFLAGYLVLAPSPPADERWDGYARDTVLLTGTAAEPGLPADGSREGRSFVLKHVRILRGFGTPAKAGAFPSETASEGAGREDFPFKTVPEGAERVPAFRKGETVLCRLTAESALPRIGSSVTVEGKAALFGRATNPGEFDYRAYQRARGCVLFLREAAVLEESEDHDRILQGLFLLRCRVAAFFFQTLGREDGALACAMVLGEKSGLDGEIRSLYQKAGIAHLLAISGLHISMIGLGVLSVLKRLRLPPWIYAPVSGLILWAYAAMTGLGVSVRRAAFMFSMTLAAGLCGRTADPLTSLALAAVWILTGRPGLAADAGFQLSFSAVAGIAAVVPVLRERGLRRQQEDESLPVRAAGLLRDGALTSFGVTLAMLPFLLAHFYEWNPWSVPANLLVIPLMGVLLSGLFLLAFLGLLPGGPGFVRGAACAAGLPVKGIFFLYRSVCQGIAALPAGSLRTGAPAGWQLFLFGAGLGALVWLGRRLRPCPRILLAALLPCIFLLRRPEGLRITMLDVGQGECVCLETPGRGFWLLDAGSGSNAGAGERQIVPYLKYRGARGLEGILISHWDEDHISGLEDIFRWAKGEHFVVGGLYLPDTALRDEALERLLCLAARYEIPVERISAGMVLHSEGVRLTCLHPLPGQTAEERNHISAVLRLDYGPFSALFTGDLEEEGERWLTDTYGRELLDCTLLDAGHHGAANASGDRFLQAADPAAILITCGRNNRYGHPAPAMLERAEQAGIPCFITARSGAISVLAEGDRLTIAPFLSE